MKHAILHAQLAVAPVVLSVFLVMLISNICITIVVILTVQMGMRKITKILHVTSVHYLQPQNVSLAIRHVKFALLPKRQTQLLALVAIHLE